MTSPTPSVGNAATAGLGNTNSNSESLFSHFDPTNQPDQKTLIYSPQVQIIIARGNKQYDVSEDITRGGIIRRENSASSLAFSLANKDLRYNGKFHRMDRVVVFMTRVKKVQVFSGYLDSVPYQQLYGGEVNFRATCTLKRLMNTWWDPNLPGSFGILNAAQLGRAVDGDGQIGSDAGMSSLIRKLLTEVGGWDNSNIHIQNFPLEFLEFVQANLLQGNAETAASLEKYKQLFLGSGDTSIGVGAAAASASNVSMGTYSLGQQFYVAEIIKAADGGGAGPVSADISKSQDVGQAAQAGSSSFGGSQDASNQELIGIAQNWQTQARNSDGAILAVACGLAESGLRVLTNPLVPDSYNFPNDGEGHDHDSVGIFQQRANGAWGSTAQRMNPRASADMFIAALNRTQWRNKEPGQAIFDVQIGGSPSYYTGFIAQATTLVQTARGNLTNTPSAPTLGTPAGNLGGGSLPITPAEVTSQVQGAAGNVPGKGGLGPAPTSPGPALTAEARAQIGKPERDVEGACNWAKANAALVRYSYGGPGYPNIDCSQFTQLAMRSIGIELPRSSGAQANVGTLVPTGAPLVAGDIMANGGHAQIYIGNGLIISNGGPAGSAATVRALQPGEAGEYTVRRVGDWGGPDPSAPFVEPTTASPGVSPSSSGSASNGTGSTGSTEPIARNLFTFQFLPTSSQFAPSISSLFTGEKSFIMAEPLMQTVQAVCRGSLRTFASAPNGDFVAYYPDYFGLDGKPAVLDLAEIECKSVKIDFSDDQLTTHVYVAGSESLYTPGITPYGWLETQGVATVEDQWLFAKMRKIAPGAMEDMDGGKLMQTFGVRPLKQEFPQVQHGPMEKMLAIQLFMQKWAEQYATAVEFTFMPELFPGMRISLSNGGLQAYVSQVEHSFDFENGFTTNATIQAPSNLNTKRLISGQQDTGGGTNSPAENDFFYSGGT